MHNFKVYNYLMSSTLGLMVKGTELEGVNLLDSFNCVQNMSQEELCKICKHDDLRLVEDGRFKDTIAYNSNGNEEQLDHLVSNQSEVYKYVETFWVKKSKEELIDILFGADYDDGGFGNFKYMKEEVDKIAANPVSYLMEAVDEKWENNRNSHEIKFEGLEYDAAPQKPQLNDVLAEKLLNEVKEKIEGYYKQTLKYYSVIGEHTEILLKESIVSLKYEIEKGGFENLDLDNKDKDVYNYDYDKDSFYWADKEDSDDTEYPEREVDHTLFVVNFKGKVVSGDNLSVPIEHAVWVRVKLNEFGGHISYKIENTFI